MEGSQSLQENESLKAAEDAQSHQDEIGQSIPRRIVSTPKRNKIRIAVSVDLDAVSGWLGTGEWRSLIQFQKTKTSNRSAFRQCPCGLFLWLLCGQSWGT